MASAGAISFVDNRDIPALAWRGAPPSLNPMKVLAVTAIGLTLLGPAVALGVAGRIPLSEQEFGSGGGSQTAGPPASQYSFSPLMAEYIRNGKAGALAVQRTAQKIEEQHPLERAYALAEARQNLQKNFQPGDRDKLAGLLHQEVEALQEAADGAPTPKAKVELIQRGLKQIDLFVPIRDLAVECASGNSSECLDSASLWKQTSELFFGPEALSPDDCRDLFPDAISPFHNPFYLSSLCLRYAGNSLRGWDSPDIQDERQAYLVKAIEYMKTTATQLEKSYDRGLIYEQIGDTYATLWKMHEHQPQEAALFANETVKAAVKARDHFVNAFTCGCDPRAEDLTRASQMLVQAGNYSPTLTKKLEFYREAQSLAGTARGLCGRDFPSLTENNIHLLNTISCKIREVRLAQEEEEWQNSTIVQLWSSVTRWFTS